MAWGLGYERTCKLGSSSRQTALLPLFLRKRDSSLRCLSSPRKNTSSFCGGPFLLDRTRFPFPFISQAPRRMAWGLGYERTCKPGSVERGHLSTPAVTDGLQRYSRTFSGGQPCVKRSQTCIGRGLHGTGRYRPVGELLPRLSILASSKQISLPALRLRKERFLFDCFSSSQKILLRNLFREPCEKQWAKEARGGLFLLHFP